MQLALAYDPRADVWTLEGHDVRLRTAADIAAFRESLAAAMRGLGGARDFVLMDVSDMEVDLAVVDAYGAALEDVLAPLVHDLLRYGRPLGFTPTVMMLAAQKRAFAPHLYPDRQSALVALRRLRSRTAPRAPAARVGP